MLARSLQSSAVGPSGSPSGCGEAVAALDAEWRAELVHRLWFARWLCSEALCPDLTAAPGRLCLVCSAVRGRNDAVDGVCDVGRDLLVLEIRDDEMRLAEEWVAKAAPAGAERADDVGAAERQVGRVRRWHVAAGVDVGGREDRDVLLAVEPSAEDEVAGSTAGIAAARRARWNPRQVRECGQLRAVHSVQPPGGIDRHAAAAVAVTAGVRAQTTVVVKGRRRLLEIELDLPDAAMDVDLLLDPAVVSNPTRRPRFCAIAFVTTVVPLTNDALSPISASTVVSRLRAALPSAATTPSV